MASFISLDDLCSYSCWPVSSLDELHNYSHWPASSLDDFLQQKLINVSSLACKQGNYCVIKECFDSDTLPLSLKFGYPCTV